MARVPAAVRQRCSRAPIPPHVDGRLSVRYARERDGRSVAPRRDPATAEVPAFDIALVRVDRFEEHVWLAPEPSERFVALTELTAARFPDWPPYDGAFEEVIPHLTVGCGKTPTQWRRPRATRSAPGSLFRERRMGSRCSRSRRTAPGPSRRPSGWERADRLRRVSVTVPPAEAERARAVMLELFPEGFEERDSPDGVELTAYTDAGGEERLWSAFGGARSTDVEEGWEDRWRAFHRPVRIGPLWVGPPWEQPDADAIPVVIDPGRAFGTGAHATTRLCLELLLDVPGGSLLDVGCGSGVLSIAAAKLGFGPVSRSTSTRRRSRRPSGTRRRTASPSRPGSPTRADDAAAGGATPPSSTSPSRSTADRRAARRARASSPPATSSPRRPASRLPPRVTGARPTAGPPTCTFGRSKVRADGDVLGRLPRLQGLARRRAGGARTPARRRPRGARRAATSPSLNTCCVTHEALRKSRHAASRAARTHRRVYVTGCGANLSADAFAGLPENVVVIARRERGDAGERSRATSARSAASRPTPRLDRVRAFVKVQDGCCSRATSA